MEKILKADGWYLERIHGSHYQYKHKIKRGIVSLPHHSGDYKPKTEKSIYKQAGLK
jgi:predicted RNA binding protein YcfA (HicA-like mRNA interferase family)